MIHDVTRQARQLLSKKLFEYTPKYVCIFIFKNNIDKSNKCKLFLINLIKLFEPNIHLIRTIIVEQHVKLIHLVSRLVCYTSLND